MTIEQQEDQPTNVLAFTPIRREPPLTPEELAEYRRIRPAVLQMLEEWQKLRVGCPIARRTIR